MPNNPAAYQREWKAAHPELRREADRRRDKDKVAARSKLNHLVRVGRLSRPESCSECGRVPEPDRLGRSRIEAHHPDHREPLRVEWKCRACHIEADRRAA